MVDRDYTEAEHKEVREAFTKDLKKDLEAYVEVRTQLATERMAYITLLRSVEHREVQVEFAAWAQVHQHNTHPDNAKSRITEPMAKAQVADYAERELAHERGELAKQRAIVEAREGDLSVAREELRFAYAMFALVTGHNLMGQNMGAL